MFFLSPQSPEYPLVVLASTLIFPGLFIGLWIFFSRGPKASVEPFVTELLRRRLPSDLIEWRQNKRYISAWNTLRNFFAAHGYTLWSFDSQRPGFLVPPGYEYGVPNGFCFIPPSQNYNASANIRTFISSSSMLWPAGHSHGDVVIRILSAGGQGQRQLNILRQVANAPTALIRTNHALPLFREIALHDVVFGVFPRVTTNLARVLVDYSQISSMDKIEMFTQCLEALAFLHVNLIAHLNVFPENFLVDYPPESSLHRLTGRARVYIADFDSAVSFLVSLPPEERLCGAEQFIGDQYRRPRAPEVQPQASFSPFPVDCWQFSVGIQELVGFKKENVTALFQKMAHEDPACRPTAKDALAGLQIFEHEIMLEHFALEEPAAAHF